VREDLPTGTVTFLFTDVEGSTRLLEEIGDEAYEQALSVHRRIVRAACQAHDGVEVDTQGDAFFFAFPEPSGALAAAQQMTEGLGAGPIQVRVGLHTGMPRLGEEGYVGSDVHFGARVAASAHGGQVVLSQATRDLVDGSVLTDLGEHRLKDIENAVAIFQLGDESFPPLKTISNTNLPRPASSFVGREAERSEVLARIEQGARLVTLTGPGGSGKTRLALEAASSLVPEYKAGVFWVGLAALRDPALVMETIAQTLGAMDGLPEHIGEREMLLLLDNLEQVIESAPDLSQLLAACPNLTLLVTSRELLRVQGEVEYEVPPLKEPEAVSLFCERAQLRPSEDIRELCFRLDNLPLAVELAAARTKALSPAQILERLSQRLDLLKGGRDADPRQQTLRATIEWSYDLLSEKEQRLFRALSVFAGGCTLEAAEEVADADIDTLQSLVEKSLLRFTDERYWMLETIREYGGERLEKSSASEDSGETHAAYYLALAERVHDAESTDGSKSEFRLLGIDHDNLRLALSWFLRREAAEPALRLVAALGDYWVVRGHVSEARSQVEASLAIAADASPALRVNVLALASDFARDQGDIELARTFCEESLSLSREMGDLRGVGRALHELGEAAMAEDDFESAIELFEEAVTAGRAGGINGAGSIGNLGYIALLQGDYERARALSEEATELFRERGHQSGVSVGLALLADAELLLGRTEDARLRTRECLEFAKELGFKEVIASGLDTSAALIAESRDSALAARLAGAADAVRHEIKLSQSPAERRLHHRMRDALKSSLGARALEELHEQGRRLEMDEAVELALRSLD
jgi:predicted ATPase/class 3 adenylate cyclase